MIAKKLVSMRVLENDWDDFKQWADGQGSNATAEINRYIRQCLNRNDNDNEALQTVNTPKGNEDIQELRTAIANLTNQLNGMAGELEAVKKLESVA